MKARKVSAPRITRGLRSVMRVAEPQVVGLPSPTTNERRTDTKNKKQTQESPLSPANPNLWSRKAPGASASGHRFRPARQRLGLRQSAGALGPPANLQEANDWGSPRLAGASFPAHRA